MSEESRTLVDVWAEIRRKSGDDVAQEAACQTLSRSRRDQVGYFLYVVGKLNGSGFSDQRSRENRRRHEEVSILVPFNPSINSGKGNLSIESYIDLKNSVASLSPEKRVLIQRAMDGGKPRGWRVAGLKTELSGGKTLVLSDPMVLGPRKEAMYRERYARGEHIPRAIARRLGLKDRRCK